MLCMTAQGPVLQDVQHVLILLLSQDMPAEHDVTILPACRLHVAVDVQSCRLQQLA